MKIISHRGNLNGSNTAKFGENHPYSITYVLQKTNFDVEVDIWAIDGNFWLGHNNPGYYIGNRESDFNQIADTNNSGRCWLHAKNLEALWWLKNKWSWDFNVFWHNNDDYTLTSKGFIWTYPAKDINYRGHDQIIVDHSRKKLPQNLYGVCTDYPLEQKEIQNQCQS